MKKYYSIVLIILLTLISCGESKKELELIEKQKIDQQKIEKQKIHQQKINVGKVKNQNNLDEALSIANSALARAEQEYNEINLFQFGRSQTTKDRQLRDAQKQINDLRDYVRNIKDEIAELELSKTFDFQKRPEDVVKHLFFAAKNKDFSKLRYLCDPYAENDEDTGGLCHVGMLTQSNQNQFIQNFRNGRIIGNPIINGDKAEVEFAFGQSSNLLEKMNLINRMGLWYLSSF